MVGGAGNQRLTTWAEIAAYIGRDSRTAKRYETERRLPIHRMPGGGRSTVYAFTRQLDAWLLGVHDEPEAPGPVAPLQPALPPDVKVSPPFDAGLDEPVAEASVHEAGSIAPRRKLQRRLVYPVGAGLALLAAAAVYVARPAAGSRHPPDASAQAYYLSGQYAWERRTGTSLHAAVDDFTQAVVRDPEYAAAYAGLADAYDLMPEFKAMTAAEAFPRAKAAAERAVALDPQSAQAHRALAFVDFWWSRDVKTADREFRTALRLDPNSALTHHWYANALAMVGDSHRALEEIGRAQALNPAGTAIMADKGWILTLDGQLDAAAKTLTEVETVQPDYAPAYRYMAQIHENQGDDEGMLRDMGHWATLLGDGDELSVVDAGRKAFAGGGRAAMLLAMTSREEVLANGGGFSPYVLAVNEARLGRRERAIDLLAKSVAIREATSVGIASNPVFAGLHDDPRFRKLLSQLASAS